MKLCIGIFGRMLKVFMTTAVLVLALATSAMAYWTITDIGTLGGSNSEGEAINNSGQVTGYSSITGIAATHAFLYSAGKGMQDIGTLDATVTKLNASDGSLVGTYPVGNQPSGIDF